MTTRRTVLLGLAALPAVGVSSAFAGSKSRKGSFIGKKGHVTTGSVQVSADKVVLGGDFFFDGAPTRKWLLARMVMMPRP